MILYENELFFQTETDFSNLLNEFEKSVQYQRRSTSVTFRDYFQSVAPFRGILPKF